ncbi:GNAT family N-acetyltransferase [Tatumella terrea]|uniref:GNAT family N-acetyltransferase n=1 Tax=Tatumella terrea TaxID=419007 RepID=A0ABW1VYX2_9GAMM
MMELGIRKASSGDLKLLHDLARVTYRTHYSQIWLSKNDMEDYINKEYSYESIRKSLANPRVTWYLIVTDRPIGFAKVIWEMRVPGTGRVGVFLSKLYLDEGATGKGYGKHIVELIMQYSKDKGYDYFWLEVIKQNERACRFYESQGLNYISNGILKAGAKNISLKIMGKDI